MSLRGGVAIVGVAESDLGEVGAGFTPLDLIGQAASRVLDDAGLEKEDVDGLFSVSAYYHMPTLSVGEYLGIRYTVRKRSYPHGCCRKRSGMRLFRTSSSCRSFVHHQQTRSP
jgi:hypothetical protein